MNRFIKTILGLAAAVVLLTACTVVFEPDELHNEKAGNRDAPKPVENVTPRPRPTPSRPAVPNFPLNETQTYSCEGGRLLVKYTSNDSVEVFADGWQELTRTTSRDGWFVYKDSKHEWYAHRDRGLLRRDGKDLMTDCRL